MIIIHCISACGRKYPVKLDEGDVPSTLEEEAYPVKLDEVSLEEEAYPEKLD